MAFSADPRLTLRKALLEKRAALSREESLFRSEAVCDQFVKWASTIWKPADFQDRIVALYAVSPTQGKGELDPAFLKKASLFTGALFAYPRILSLAEGRMEFALPVHDSDWVTTKLGIPEPRPELPLLEPKDIALFIVPGVVFGERGERIGQGGGFYDRYLKRSMGAFRVGLAYDFQIVRDRLPENSWDQRVDWVIGETTACFPKPGP